MTKINLITAPDILYNDAEEILLLYPTEDFKFDLQEKYLNKIKHDVNVYIMENTPAKLDFEWAVNVFRGVDVCIIDADNAHPDIKPLLSYFVSKNKTFWLTKDDHSVYTYVSKNRVFDTTFLLERNKLYEKK